VIKGISHGVAPTVGARRLYPGEYCRALFLLPLGLRVQDNIKAIIKEEMDQAGAQEMVSPVLHPLELWKETNRTNTAGFELMRVKDRRGAEFALGGTAEEMFVDVVRKFAVTYKDLPFNVYQFSTKFRDELRARGGLLRVREFVMKDAYSFHADQADFEREYELMAQVYSTIFSKLGLETIKTEAGNGYIGGEYSHEFQSPCETGEDTTYVVPSTGQAYNQEIAPATAPRVHYSEEPMATEDVLGEQIVGVKELAAFLKIPVEKTTKTMLFTADNDRIIAAAVRGGYDISEEKLKKIVNTTTLTLANEETVRKVTGAEVGYAGILNLPEFVEVYVDESCDNRVNFEMGANKTNYHTINVNWDRDIAKPERFYDFKLAQEGDMHPDTGEVYRVVQSVEVGNIFQLGYHYSHLMNGAVFVDRDGKAKPYYMGCYGIGLGRTLATIVEKYHDDRGIVWPEAVAPYKVHLVSLKGAETYAEVIYNQLREAGIEVLWDDRNESPGVKFADADLLGMPVRLVVSTRNGDKLEWKRRDQAESEIISADEVMGRL
jgi:prolyl-tRNA synthetase